MASLRYDGLGPLLLHPLGLLPDCRHPPAKLIKKHCFTAVESTEHIPALVQMMGSENFFFGTDYPHGEYQFLPNNVETYVNLPLPDRDKENILGRTMLRALKRA